MKAKCTGKDALGLTVSMEIVKYTYVCHAVLYGFILYAAEKLMFLYAK